MHHIDLSRYVGHGRHTAVSHCQTCNLGDSRLLVLSLYWAQPGEEEGGERERGREEEGGGRRTERREGKRRKVARWRKDGGKEGGKEE